MENTKTRIKSTYSAGAIGRVSELQAVYYSTFWQFGTFFESKITAELAEFLSRFDEQQDLFLTVEYNNCIEGSIIVDAAHADTEGAHLRWFIVSDALRGQGYGRSLIQKAVDYCKDKQYSSIYLWTMFGLDPAIKLYNDLGFVLVHEESGDQWGSTVIEQKYFLDLA